MWRLLVFLLAIAIAIAFRPSARVGLVGAVSRRQDGIQMMATPGTTEYFQELVDGNKVLLFMKGNKIFPQCGFSNTACRILDAVGQPFETVNVLDDDRVRNGVKDFSSWPTIPQLYVDGEFIGGTDVMIELYQNGELAEMIEVATAS